MIPWVAAGLSAVAAWAWKYRTRIAAWGSAVAVAWRMRWLRRRVRRLEAAIAREQTITRTYEEHDTIEDRHADIDRQIRQARTPDDLNRLVDRLRRAAP